MKKLFIILFLIAICDIKAQKFETLLFGRTHKQIRSAYEGAGQKELSILKTGNTYCVLFSPATKGFIGIAYEFDTDTCVAVWFYFLHAHEKHIKSQLKKNAVSMGRNIWFDGNNTIFYGKFAKDVDFLKYTR